MSFTIGENCHFLTQDILEMSLRGDRTHKFFPRKLSSFPFESDKENGDAMYRVCSYWKAKKIMKIFDNLLPRRDFG